MTTHHTRDIILQNIHAITMKYEYRKLWHCLFQKSDLHKLIMHEKTDCDMPGLKRVLYQSVPCILVSQLV